MTTAAPPPRSRPTPPCRSSASPPTSMRHCELGHLDQAGELLESVFDAISETRGERELLRTLAAAAYVLEVSGERALAARALGRAEPLQDNFQDNFVDAIGTARTRLSERLGAATTANLALVGALGAAGGDDPGA
jgi:hypothetical protein